MGFRFILCGLVVLSSHALLAAEDLPLIPEDIQLLPGSLLWDKLISVHAGYGYKDNVLLSPFIAEGSPFFVSGLEVTLMRLPVGGWQFAFDLEAEDIRYLQRVDVNKEQTLMALSQFKKFFGDGWQSGANLIYFYQDQVQDVSLVEANLSTARVQGHNVTMRPFVRWDFATNWWAQLEASGTRQLLRAPLDNFWEAGPRLTLARDYGHASEVRLSYWLFEELFDTQNATDASGNDLPGTSLTQLTHNIELRLDHYWDARRHWCTTALLGLAHNADNGAGYFNYWRYQTGGQLAYRDDHWEIKGQIDLSYYDFPVRTASTVEQISPPGASKLHDATFELDVRAVRKLTKLLKIYAEFKRDRWLSNEAADAYLANTVSGGLELEF